jgi:hypothetical protein
VKPIASLLTIAVHLGTVVAAFAMVQADWLSMRDAVVIGFLVLLYAAATATFGPWRWLAAAAGPALGVLDLALFIDQAAFDCYPNCSVYQNLLGTGLNLGMGLYLLVLGLAIWHIAWRRRQRRSYGALRLGR